MRFRRVYIEISNVCNLHCSFCSPRLRPARTMSAREFQGIAAQLRPYTDYLYLHVKGEPLLHPQLPEILDVCRELGFQVNITTNGTLLRERQELLLDSPAVRQVNLSVHSFREQGGDGEAYLGSLLDFGAAALVRGRPYVIYRMWNLSPQTGMDEESRALLRRIGETFCPELDLARAMEGRNSAQAAANVFLSWEQEFTWPSLSHPVVSVVGRCHGAREMMAILADGTAVPCCLDAEGGCALGNVFSQPVQEIVESQQMKRIVRGFERDRVAAELCRRCTYRLRFDKGQRKTV